MPHRNPEEASAYHLDYYKKNKDRLKAKRKKWAEANPDSVLNTQLKKRFGITLEQYNLMAEEQEFRCWICRQECGTGHRLSVDHDHLTGQVRGLLCKKCNSGIGFFSDHPALLERALEYLQRS